jgi:hypothetical protein
MSEYDDLQQVTTKIRQQNRGAAVVESVYSWECVSGFSMGLVLLMVSNGGRLRGGQFRVKSYLLAKLDRTHAPVVFRDEDQCAFGAMARENSTMQPAFIVPPLRLDLS